MQETEWWITGQGAGVEPYAPAHAAGGARRSDSDGGRVRGRRPRAEDQPPGRRRVGSRELVFGKKGIIKRIRDITPETKLVYCKWDDAFQAQPVPYLKVAQCGSFITEFPEKAVEYLIGIDIDAMLESVCSNPALPDGFKQKLSAWSRDF